MISIADKVKLAAAVAELGTIVTLISDWERRMPVSLRHAEEELNMLSILGDETEQIVTIRDFLQGVSQFHRELYQVAHNTGCDVGKVLDAIRRLDFLPTSAPAIKQIAAADVKTSAAKAVVAAGGVK